MAAPMDTDPTASSRWAGAWPDAVAFAVGLALAWGLKWNTTDLVWSLWLSSLVVGYALILWLVSEPLRGIIGGWWSDQSGIGSTAAKAGAVALVGAGTLFAVAFFTVHFGGFHFVHSTFLNHFFPIAPGRRGAFIDVGLYAEVLRRYWWFLPVAFLAERQAFGRTMPDSDVAVTPAAIARRKARGDVMIAPYKNVIRMHLLIFFFAFAHFAHLESFLVYAIVYAVYFFPWRLVRREKPAAIPV
jgi:hypothetical protein